MGYEGSVLLPFLYGSILLVDALYVAMVFYYAAALRDRPSTSCVLRFDVRSTHHVSASGCGLTGLPVVHKIA